MIRVTLTDDAPEIETVPGDGFVRIETMTTAEDEDSVTFRESEQSSPVSVLVSAAVTQRTSVVTPKSVQHSEMRVRERDLPGYGFYEIACYTRRKQKRVYSFEIVKDTEEEGKLSFVIDPKTTQSSWVTEEDVFPTSKTEKIVISAHL